MRRCDVGDPWTEKVFHALKNFDGENETGFRKLLLPYLRQLLSLACCLRGNERERERKRDWDRKTERQQMGKKFLRQKSENLDI